MGYIKHMPRGSSLLKRVVKTGVKAGTRGARRGFSKFAKRTLRKDKKWLRPLENTQSSWSRYIYTFGPWGGKIGSKTKRVLYEVGRNLIFDFDRVPKKIIAFKRAYIYLTKGKKALGKYHGKLKKLYCPSGKKKCLENIDRVISPPGGIRREIRSFRSSGMWDYDGWDVAATVLDWTVTPVLKSAAITAAFAAPIYALITGQNYSDVFVGSMLFRMQYPHIFWGGLILGAGALPKWYAKEGMRNHVYNKVEGGKIDVDRYSDGGEIEHPWHNFVNLTLDSSADEATASDLKFEVLTQDGGLLANKRRDLVNNTFLRLQYTPNHTDVAQAISLGDDCAFDTNRTVQFPTHTTAYPSCTGYQKSYYDGTCERHMDDATMETVIDEVPDIDIQDKACMDGCKGTCTWDGAKKWYKCSTSFNPYRYYTCNKQPLLANIVATATDDFNFKTTSTKIMPVPDIRNNAIYKCVETKPTSGIYFPSKWVDPVFLRGLDYEQKYHHNLSYLLKKDETTTWFKKLPQYKMPQNPGHFNELFYGYDKSTMCDEELQLLVLWGRQSPHLDTRFQTDLNLRTFETTCWDVDDNYNTVPATTKSHCEARGFIWGGFTDVQDKCLHDGEQVTATDRNHCGACEDSQYDNRMACFQAKKKWTPYEWQQLPNVNEALTCYGACGGWCQRMDAITDSVSLNTCSLSKRYCDDTTPCAKVCSDDPDKTCAHDSDCCAADDSDCETTCVEQDCMKNISECSLFSRTENVRNYCDITQDDSKFCTMSWLNTRFEPGELAIRQTNGKKGYYDDKGKCGVGFATKYDSDVQWCNNEQLMMKDVSEETRGRISASYAKIGTGCPLALEVSQLCELQLPETFFAKPFDFESIYHAQLEPCFVPVTKQECHLFSRIHELGSNMTSTTGTACKIVDIQVDDEGKFGGTAAWE